MSNYNDGWSAGHKVGYDVGRVEGQNETWEAVAKIVRSRLDGGYSTDALLDMFGDWTLENITKRYTAEEALKKINDYEETTKLERGDIVEIWYGEKRSNDPYGIFYTEDENDYIVLIKRTETPQNLPKFDYILKKTGKHVDLFSGLEDKE